jgi:hypothetical protein
MFTALLVGLIMAAPPAPPQQSQQPQKLEDDQLPLTYRAEVSHPQGLSSDGLGGVLGRQANGSLLGIDTVVNFSSYFYRPGLAFSQFGAFPQFTWPYTMVGRPPFGRDSSEHTTRIDAPVVPVIVDLRNADGSPRFVGANPLVSDPTKFVQPVLNSPVFQDFRYSSSEKPTQFTDAVHRASFFSMSDDDWHTLLKPSVKQPRRMTFLRGTYLFALNPDGTCCAFIIVDFGTFVNGLFPATPDDTATVIGGAEHDGDITTKDISSFLLPDTYLADFTPAGIVNCCALGFHSFDLEPGDESNGFRERHYVVNYSAYTTSGIFGPTFSDITPLSHELAETFADPFGSNATPVWVAPNGLCQNNLEVGDVIEGLPNSIFPIKMNGFVYHPQNEALLQWFAGSTPSNAVKHAYSYPDTTVLTSPSVSFQGDCKTPFTGIRTPRSSSATPK